MTVVSVFKIWYLICIVIRALSLYGFIDEHEEEICFQDRPNLVTFRELSPKGFKILLFVVIMVCSLLWPVSAICDIKNRISKRRNA